MNVYLSTNLFSIFSILIILMTTMFFQRKTFRNIKIKDISLVSLLVSLSVMLTNFISYNIPILPGGIKLALGDWIIFLIGLIFGPLFGVVGGITSDLVGTLINIGGVYHSGFMLDKVILGVFGGFVFLTKNNKFIKLKIITYFTIAYSLISLILNNIWLYASGWSDAIFVSIIIKLIKLPISLIIYESLLLISFVFIKGLLSRYFNTHVWCTRHENEFELKAKEYKKENNIKKLT